jgi:small conductance mechanosensitive channel
MNLFAQTSSGLADTAASIWQQSIHFLSAKGLDFSINLMAAIVIFFVGRLIAKFLKTFCHKLMMHSKVDETLARFLGNIIHSLLMMLVILAAIDQLGINTTSFAAVIAAAGLAVGFALQSSLANFASGVMLILFKPFEVGDFINAGGSAGVVEEIHIFSTLMRTGDNIQIVIPNNQITNGTITNFSAKETRRIDMEIGCSYDDNLKDVKDYLESVIKNDDRILSDPEPVVAVNELGESSVNFVLRPWVNSEDFSKVRWDLTEQIKLGFDEKGFHFPYPTRDVVLQGNNPL